jgi:hypothetical protein
MVFSFFSSLNSRISFYFLNSILGTNIFLFICFSYCHKIHTKMKASMMHDLFAYLFINYLFF